MNRIHFLIVVLLFATSGCTTPYQKESPWNMVIGGYSEEKTGPNEYALKYGGTKYTSHDSLERMWHTRATELCDSKDYESTVERKNEDNSQTTAIPVGGVFLPMTLTASIPFVAGTVKCKEHEQGM